MANNTIIRVPEPRFGINEVVYLLESALLGYLEPVKVAATFFDPNANKTFYTFVFKKNMPNSQIAGDAIDLKSGNIIHIIEDEIISYQEALIIVQETLEKELIKTEQKLQASVGFPIIDIITPGSTEPTLNYGNVEAPNITSNTPGSFIAVTYEITNTGEAQLILSDTLVSISADPDFTVYAQPDRVIDPGDSSSFVIRFAPITIGRRVGAVSIANNDPESNPISFTIEGTGT